MKIIDFHTHPGPKSILTEEFHFPPMTSETFVSELKRAGISMACGSTFEVSLLSVRDSAYGIQEMNRIAWSYHEDFPDFFIPGLQVDPRFMEESKNELETYAKKGAKLVGELVPGWQDYENMLNDGFYELFDVMQSFDLVLSFHRPGNIFDCEEIAKRFPKLKIVIAHPFYGKDYLNVLGLVKKYENLHLDLSGSGLMAYGMVRYGLDTVGKDKILFGTDFPGYNPQMYVSAVAYEKLTDAELEAVYHENAERLLGL